MATTITTTCQCGTLVLVRDVGAAADDRTECPDCHTTAHHIEVVVTDDATTATGPADPEDE